MCSAAWGNDVASLSATASSRRWSRCLDRFWGLSVIGMKAHCLDWQWHHNTCWMLNMCEAEGVVLTARPGQGPLVTFAQDFSPAEQQTKVCYIRACFDGFLLTMRSMEYLSKTKTFDKLEVLSRADVVISPGGTRGSMFIKRYRGDKKQQWPAKQFSPALGGKLCALALRLVYEELNPVPWGVGIGRAAVPY
jgi:hypothetical protein